MKKLKRTRETLMACVIALLALLYSLCCFKINNLDQQRQEAVETASALSDMVRIHMDNDPEFKEFVEDYTNDLKILGFHHIDSINWHKYNWAY